MPDDVRFLVDTQLPPALAKFFRQRGYGATHAVNYPTGALLQDDEIIAIADLFQFMDNNLDTIIQLFEENIERLVAINRDRVVIY